mmetsp:Transcript_1967/g.2917  ORF Transcript_1967/g.2917 Transcript_1967/m.2917 type:complete len:249 (-) Transcript_1967:908-1654(-)
MLPAIFIVLSLVQLALAGYGTDKDSCIPCYKAGHVHCVDSTFLNGYCCTESDTLERCMNRYDYCTSHLQYSIYKVFTCPMQDNCPSGGLKHIEHTEIESLVEDRVAWTDPGKFCKIKVSASSHMNGKMKFYFNSVQGATAYLYLQPNDYDHDTVNAIGMAENKKVYSYPKQGKSEFEVPTDWSFYLTYTPTGSGYISFSTWVEPLVESDEAKVLTTWKPTGVKYEDPEVERLRIEEEERQRKEKERIE